MVAERLVEAGCKVLMPWGAPIGSGKGLSTTCLGLRALRAHFPDVPLIVDAGVGAAVARRRGDGAWVRRRAAQHRGRESGRFSLRTARAFALAIEAGRAAFLSGPMQPRDMAAPSTPVVGRAVLT